MQTKFGKRQLKDYGWAYLMILPTIAGLMVLNVIPVFQTIYTSLMKAGDFGKTSTFVGLKNYVRLFKDPEVLRATWNTFLYTLGVVPIGILIALFVAVLLNAQIKGKTLFRTIFFLPIVTSSVAIAMVWGWLYNGQYGLINYALSGMGMQGAKWLTDPSTAMFAIVIVGIWSGLGYNVVLLLAGLQEIPTTFYEAADIDGAGPIRQFFKITIPLLSPTMFFVVILSIIGSLQVFELIYMMFLKTNPALSSVQSLVYLFYKHSFIINDRAYGSTIVTFLLAIILVITGIQMKLQKKWVHYD